MPFIARLTALAWLLSEDRRALRWRVPLIGIALQFAIAVLMLKLPWSQGLFATLNDAVLALQDATRAGTSFVFGYLGGGALPFAEIDPAASFVFAFSSLPLVIVMSALTALLAYWRILPLIVNGLSALLERTLGVGGAVALSTAANVFVGMVEAPLLIRGYLRALSRAELFMVMTAGMATIAGTVLVIYATLLAPVMEDAAGHLLTASLISAPAAILFAWLMVPQRADSARTAAPGLARSEATSTAVAPSEIWLDTAAVSRPPGISVGSLAIFSRLVSRRGPSSFLTSPYGSISPAKRPSSMARIARRWLSSAKRSMSSRVMFHFSAISSAPRNCDTSCVP